jgi:hypothetical protein
MNIDEINIRQLKLCALKIQLQDDEFRNKVLNEFLEIRKKYPDDCDNAPTVEEYLLDGFIDELGDIIDF